MKRPPFSLEWLITASVAVGATLATLTYLVLNDGVRALKEMLDV